MGVFTFTKLRVDRNYSWHVYAGGVYPFVRVLIYVLIEHDHVYRMLFSLVVKVNSGSAFSYAV